MRSLLPAVAVVVLTMSIEWIAQQAHGPVWFAFFVAVAVCSAAYLIYQRATVGAVITAVTDIIEEHAGRRLLNEHRKYLLVALAQVDQCKPNTPDLGGIWVGLQNFSKHLSERLERIGGVNLPEFADPRPSPNEFDEMRRVIRGRIDAVDAALAELPSAP